MEVLAGGSTEEVRQKFDSQERASTPAADMAADRPLGSMGSSRRGGPGGKLTRSPAALDMLLPAPSSQAVSPGIHCMVQR